MLYDIVNVKTLGGYELLIEFDNGISGRINISQVVPFKGIFAKLNDKKYFETVKVNPDVGTICWKNGADIAPCILYSLITKTKKKHH